jgi:hypothetical protein
MLQITTPAARKQLIVERLGRDEPGSDPAHQNNNNPLHQRRGGFAFPSPASTAHKERLSAMKSGEWESSQLRLTLAEDAV